MWQVWQAWGCFASSTEKVWRVWQTSHDAVPNPGLVFRRFFISASVLIPTLWHPPQPFISSISTEGCQCIVGIAFIAAHAKACFPALYCFTLVSWQAAHVSGVGI